MVRPQQAARKALTAGEDPRFPGQSELEMGQWNGPGEGGLQLTVPPSSRHLPRGCLRRVYQACGGGGNDRSGLGDQGGAEYVRQNWDGNSTNPGPASTKTIKTTRDLLQSTGIAAAVNAAKAEIGSQATVELFPFEETPWPQLAGVQMYKDASFPSTTPQPPPWPTDAIPSEEGPTAHLHRGQGMRPYRVPAPIGGPHDRRLLPWSQDCRRIPVRRSRGLVCTPTAPSFTTDTPTSITRGGTRASARSSA